MQLLVWQSVKRLFDDRLMTIVFVGRLRLLNGHENMDDSALANTGVKDILLVKCKQSIEELNAEIQHEKRLRSDAEEAISGLEFTITEKEAALRDYSLKNEKLVEENRQIRNNLNTLLEQLEQAGKHLNYSVTLEACYNELQNKYQGLCATSDELKTKNRELTNEIKKRDQMANQWNNTLNSVDTKLADLEAEKEELLKERDELAQELETTKTLYKESQNLNQLLQGKCEYSERLATQLEQENKILQDFEEENKELQQTITRLKERSDKLAHEVTQALDQQERDFGFEKEKTIKELQKKHEEEVTNLKKEHNAAVDSLRDQITKLTVERDYVKLESQFLSGNSQLRGQEQRQGNEVVKTKLGQIHLEKTDEIKNLKSVIDEQSALINSYERIVQKLKDEKDQENQENQASIKRLKQEIQELNSKITSLNSKISEYQIEIASLQGRFKNNSIDEDKNSKIQEKSNILERQLLEKDQQIQLLRENLAQAKKELDANAHLKRDYGEELLRVRAQISQKNLENEDLQKKHHETDISLHRKLEEVTKELRIERERRIEAEHLCTGYKEQLNALELNLKKRIEAQSLELQRKDEELDQYRQAKRIELGRETIEARDTFRKTVSNTDRHTYYEASPDNYNYQNRSGAGSARRDYPLRELQNREVLEPRRRSIGKSEGNSYRNPAGKKPQQTEFLNKFKDVISQLENRLDRISHDLS